MSANTHGPHGPHETSEHSPDRAATPDREQVATSLELQDVAEVDPEVTEYLEGDTE
jgi:hypothetical protein